MTGRTLQDVLSRGHGFATVSKSLFGGPGVARTAIIESAAELKAFFDRQAPGIELTPEWFESRMMIGVAASAGFGVGVNIVSVNQMTEGIMGGYVFIHYQELRPEGKSPAMITTRPYHLVACNKFAAVGVHFNKEVLGHVPGAHPLGGGGSGEVPTPLLF